jgi:hypothetical protein
MANQDPSGTGAPLSLKQIVTPAATNSQGQVTMNTMSYLVLSANGIEEFPDTTPVALSDNYAQCIDAQVIDGSGGTVNKKFRVSGGGGLSIQGPNSCPDSLLQGSKANPTVIKPNTSGNKYGLDAPVPGNGLDAGIGCGNLAALLESSDGYKYIRGQAACDVEKAKIPTTARVTIDLGPQHCNNGYAVANRLSELCGRQPAIKRAIGRYARAVQAAGFKFDSSGSDGFTATATLDSTSRSNVISSLKCAADQTTPGTVIGEFNCTVNFGNSACAQWAAMNAKADSAEKLIDGVLKSDSACSKIANSGYCDKVAPSLKTNLAAVNKTATEDKGVKPATRAGHGTNTGAQ